MKSTRSELTDKEFEYLIQPLIRAMHVLTNELTLAHEKNERLTDGIRGALDKLDSMAWVDASHIGDGYASLVTVEDYYVQEEAEDALWSLLDVAGDDGEDG